MAVRIRRVMPSTNQPLRRPPCQPPVPPIATSVAAVTAPTLSAIASFVGHTPALPSTAQRCFRLTPFAASAAGAAVRPFATPSPPPATAARHCRWRRIVTSPPFTSATSSSTLPHGLMSRLRWRRRPPRLIRHAPRLPAEARYKGERIQVVPCQEWRHKEPAASQLRDNIVRQRQTSPLRCGAYVCSSGFAHCKPSASYPPNRITVAARLLNMPAFRHVRSRRSSHQAEAAKHAREGVNKILPTPNHTI